MVDLWEEVKDKSIPSVDVKDICVPAVNAKGDDVVVAVKNNVKFSLIRCPSPEKHEQFTVSEQFSPVVIPKSKAKVKDNGTQWIPEVDKNRNTTETTQVFDEAELVLGNYFAYCAKALELILAKTGNDLKLYTGPVKKTDSSKVKVRNDTSKKVIKEMKEKEIPFWKTSERRKK